MASAWFGGLGPGLFATILGALIGDFFWVPPLYTLQILNPSEGIDTLLFAVIGSILSLMSHALARARVAAQQANRVKDRFLAVLSHELRNPLNAATAALASIEQTAPALPEAVRHDLEVVRRNTRLQARLIDDLLDVSRIATGKLTLRCEPCDAHEFIAHTLDACRPEAAAKGLVLSADLAAQDHRLNADPARVQQVIWNLLRNAIKFTPEGGRITVTTRDGHLHTAAAHDTGVPCIVIDVSDTGPGIAPADLAQIFEPFQQGSTAPPQTSLGLGLGLAVCKALVNRQGGDITAQSSGPGRGATFRVRLPVMPASTSASKPPHPGLQILLVEDEPDSGPLLRRLIESAGHRVRLAADARGALDAARAHRFDLIISDLHLRDGTGHDLLRALRTDPGVAHPPPRAICLSGSADDGDRLASQSAGFDVHLQKPVDPRALNDLIASPAPPETAATPPS
jgi:signal transduction histidine kinase/ActR/RegA family two-component response regulator